MPLKVCAIASILKKRSTFPIGKFPCLPLLRIIFAGNGSNPNKGSTDENKNLTDAVNICAVEEKLFIYVSIMDNFPLYELGVKQRGNVGKNSNQGEKKFNKSKQCFNSSTHLQSPIMKLVH